MGAEGRWSAQVLHIPVWCGNGEGFSSLVVLPRSKYRVPTTEEHCSRPRGLRLRFTTVIKLHGRSMVVITAKNCLATQMHSGEQRSVDR